ncbi:hypothetical protein SAMN05661044_00717 [Olivibacter domesticus]|uniref:Uncharacterized protein n=1 Tax=Olivibacter domesticus TaxID=407022 RepID=A0A1H7IKN4_OLID1|nr:hypothetical protein SAMN05661044_00717 [Olivibacter domesticus]
MAAGIIITGRNNKNQSLQELPESPRNDNYLKIFTFLHITAHARYAYSAEVRLYAFPRILTTRIKLVGKIPFPTVLITN